MFLQYSRQEEDDPLMSSSPELDQHNLSSTDNKVESDPDSDT